MYVKVAKVTRRKGKAAQFLHPWPYLGHLARTSQRSGRAKKGGIAALIEAVWLFLPLSDGINRSA
jgi:hypothetical protein